MAKHKITQATKDYLSAREAVEIAEKALANAEAILKQSYAQNGVDFNIVEGKKVIIVKSQRPTYNLETLKGLVSGALLKKVTKTVIDGTKFKALVAVGDIKHDVAETVTTLTEVEAVRVYEVDEAGQEVKKATVRKVA
jgi:hypothetical protein